MALLYPAGTTFVDSAGEPLASGKIHTYENGTTTDKTTYSDAALTTAHANPIILDAAGKLTDSVYVPAGHLFTIERMTSADVSVGSDDDQFGWVATTGAIDVTDYGAAASPADSTTAFVDASNAQVDGGEIIIPPGDYDVTIATLAAANTKVQQWRGIGATINGSEGAPTGWPGTFTTTIGKDASNKTRLQVSEKDDRRASIDEHYATMSLVRRAIHTAVDRTNVGRVLDIALTVDASVGSTVNSNGEWGINVDTDNSSDVMETVGISSVTHKRADGQMWALHLNPKDETGLDTVRGLVGCEINFVADASNVNQNRVGLDLIAKSFTDSSNAVHYAAMRIRSSNASLKQASWEYGIIFEDGGNVGVTTACLLVDGGNSTSRFIQDTANADHLVGIDLSNGTYAQAPIRIAENDVIQFEGNTSNGADLGYADAGTNAFQLRRSAATRFAFLMDATPTMEIGGTQVLRERITGWAAATGTATRTTFVTSTVTLEQLAERVKALIDDAISHGLIGT